MRDADDVRALEMQLDRVVARQPAHLAVTGDLLDRWQPQLLEQVLDAFAARDLLHADRLTLLHGNHDLASSGGHPRRTADLWRLALRFWDPPPLVHARQRRFYAAIARRAAGVAARAPFLKSIGGAFRVAVVDSVPVPWRPLRFERGAAIVRHAVGCLRDREIVWLAAQRGAGPLVILVHHYPLAPPQFTWKATGPLSRFVREVRVPMSIPPDQREQFWAAATAAGTRLVLCGHVHRTRLEWRDGIAIGLNGQAGADWAGRTIAFYELSDDGIRTDTTGR